MAVRMILSLLKLVPNSVKYSNQINSKENCLMIVIFNFLSLQSKIPTEIEHKCHIFDQPVVGNHTKFPQKILEMEGI